MKEHIDELLTRICVLQDELEDEYRKSLQAFEIRRAQLADDFLRQQQHYKSSLLQFLLRTRPLVAVTAPLVYLGWIPFLLMDMFVSVYQFLCFPVYRIPKVRRSDYIFFDREDLPYLNIIEKFNCFYCSYGNGVAAYTREVAARTERYWCPIKHARRMRSAHQYYPDFWDYGDAEAFRQGLERLRLKNQEMMRNGNKSD
ncbi:MAG: hypothetical protein V4443_05370 [Pseudomonadota bacterium]